MTRQYDLIVIGSGTAAAVAAHRCAAAGWRVAVCDHQAFGGTCQLRGCDPKKVLVGAAEALDWTRRMRGRGIGGGEPVIDWPNLMAFKRGFTRPVPARRAHSLAQSGIDALNGHARFRGPRTLDIGTIAAEARFILIAAGAAPRPLGIPGEGYLASSADFLELDSLPRRIVLVGGGYIAAELSHVAARAGAQVTILEQGNRFLAPFDPDLVGWLRDRSAGLGIDIRLGTAVEGVDRTAGGFSVAAAGADGRCRIEADLVVHAAGRAPDLGALDLEAGTVQQDKGRLVLNEFLQSKSNPAVYAAGDAAGNGPPLTPVASHDAAAAAANMLNGNHQRPNYAGVPSVVFTIPPLARVGMLEAEARRHQLSFRVRFERTGDWYSARRVAEDCAGFKVLIEEGTGRLLGAHLIGPAAEETINVFALAIRAGLTADQVKSAIFAYPSAGSDIGSML